MSMKTLDLEGIIEQSNQDYQNMSTKQDLSDDDIILQDMLKASQEDMTEDELLNIALAESMKL